MPSVSKLPESNENKVPVTLRITGSGPCGDWVIEIQSCSWVEETKANRAQGGWGRGEWGCRGTEFLGSAAILD